MLMEFLKVIDFIILLVILVLHVKWYYYLNFLGLKKVESDFERLLKEKKQADVNYRVLREQSNKEKQDYDNITSSTVQAYFRSKQDHERAIAKEKV